MASRAFPCQGPCCLGTVSSNDFSIPHLSLEKSRGGMPSPESVLDETEAFPFDRRLAETIIQHTFSLDNSDPLLLERALQPDDWRLDEDGRSTRESAKMDLCVVGRQVLLLRFVEQWYEEPNKDRDTWEAGKRSWDVAKLADAGREKGLHLLLPREDGSLAVGDASVAETVLAVIGAVYLDRMLWEDVQQTVHALGLQFPIG